MIANVATSLDAFRDDEPGRLGGCLFGKDFLLFAAGEQAGRAEPYYFSRRDGSGLVAFAPGFVHRSPILFAFDAVSYFSGGVAPGALCPPRHRILQIGTPYRSRSDILACADHERSALLHEASSRNGVSASGGKDSISAWLCSPIAAPLSAADYPARDLALPPVHPELPRRGGSACRAWARGFL